MPSISKRGRLMPESPIRKLTPFAEAAKKRGVKVYHLNIGQPDIEAPKAAIEAIKNLDIKLLPYTRSEGIDVLRAQIAKYYAAWNILVSPSEIMVTTGSSEALFFLVNAIGDEGDEIIIPEPFYANYLSFSISCGINVVPIASSIDTNFALPDIGEFEKLISAKTKAILICNPGNPTGSLYTKEDIHALGRLAKKHNIYLVVDEVYREFVYDGSKHYSVMEEPNLEEQAVMIDSVSKRYSMCGARIGYLVSRNQMLMATILKFAQSRLSPPYYGQMAALAALDTPQSYFDRVVNEYKARRDLLISELQKIPEVKVHVPMGAFYCIAEFPIDNADDFSQWLLESYTYENATVMLSPGSGFYMTPGMGLSQVRLAYVINKDDLLKAVKILKHAIAAYKTR